MVEPVPSVLLPGFLFESPEKKFAIFPFIDLLWLLAEVAVDSVVEVEVEIEESPVDNEEEVDAADGDEGVPLCEIEESIDITWA